MRTYVALVAVVAATLVAVLAPPADAAGQPVLSATTETTQLLRAGDTVTVIGTDFGPSGSVSLRQCLDGAGTLLCTPTLATATTDAAGAFTQDVVVTPSTETFFDCPEGACLVRAYDSFGRGPIAETAWVNDSEMALAHEPSVCPVGSVMVGIDVGIDYIGPVANNQRFVTRAAADCGEVGPGPWIGGPVGVESGTTGCSGFGQVVGLTGREGDLLDALQVVCRDAGDTELPTGTSVLGNAVGGTGGAAFTAVVCPAGMFAVGIDGALLPDFGNPIQAIQLLCADLGGSRVSIGFADTGIPVELVSRAPTGWSGNEGSTAPSMSHDGRYVAYTSRATDIVTYSGEIGIPPPRSVFVHDRTAPASHTIRLAVPGNAEAYDPWISGDGRQVAFTTRAGMAPGDGDGALDAYVWDLDTGVTELVSLGNGGDPVTSDAELAGMSDNGRYVLFATSVRLDAADTNDVPDLYLHDREAATTTLVSRARDTEVANGQSRRGDVSDDGRWVVFESAATNLAAPVVESVVNVYLRDISSGSTALLAGGAGPFLPQPRIAADGSTAVFNTTDDPVGDGFSVPQMVAYDVATSSYRLVSHAPGDDQAAFTGEADDTVHGPAAIGPDGRHVAFVSAAANLGAEAGAPASFDVFVHDRVTDTVRHASTSPVATGTGSNAGWPAIDSTGNVTAWQDTFATYFPADANPDNDDLDYDGGTPPEASDIYLATHTPAPTPTEPRTLTTPTFETDPGAGARAGLDTVPIAGIPVEAIPFANVAIGATPLRSIDLAAAPLRSIPLRSIPLRSIPLRSITLSQLPLELPGGWAARLVGTSLEGLPLQTVTLAQVAELQVSPDPLDGVELSDVGIQSSPLRSIGIASIALGSTPLRSIPLRSIATNADGSYVEGCPATGNVPATDADALANWQDLLACLGLAMTLDLGTTLIDVDIAGAPLRSIPLRSIPLRSIDLSSSPLRSIPLRSIELSATPLRSIPLRSIVFDVASSPLRSIPLRSIPLRSIDVAASPLRSIPLRSIPLRSIVVDCQDPLGRVDCSDAETNVQTLGDVADIDLDLVIGNLEDLGDALAGYTLGDLLGVTGDATIGDVQTWLVATQGDAITLADVLIGLLLKTDYPWEELPVADMRLQNVAPTAERVTASLSFTTNGAPGDGEQAVVAVTLPPGAAYEPGSSTLGIATLSETAEGGLGFTTLDTGDPSAHGNVLTWTVGNLDDTTVDLAFAYRPGARLVEEQASATVTVGPVGGDATLSETVTATPYLVGERLRSDDDPATAPVLSDGNTLVVGHIAEAGDVDLYRIPASVVAGKRMSIDLAVPGVDQDLVLYSPVESAGVIDSAPLRSIPLRSIAVEDEGAVAPGEVVPPETLQDIPLRSIPLRSISANRDATDEAVDVLANEDPTGHYTIQVSGYNGATSTEPYVLRMRVTDPPAELQCPDARTLPHQAAEPTSATAVPAPAGTTALYVVNPSRIDATYGAGEGARVVAALEQLDDDPTLGIAGHVLAVDGDADARAAYDAWDAAPCSPNAANAVVDAIVGLVEASHASAGDTIPHVVLVGGDDVLPQARIPDLTRLSNERDYLQDVGLDNPLAGAFATEHLLSDDPYGDRDPIPWLNRLLYVPDAALGRLVETPDEIVAAIDRFVTWGGSLDPSTATSTVTQDALVTGYDFLADGAHAVADALVDALPANTPVDRTLISETWTRQDLVDNLLAGDVPYVAAVNAHFDHHRSLPGEGNATHDESDLFTTADVLDPDGDPQTPSPALDQRLLFSMGCHGGLNVPDVYVQGIEDADWAQTFAQQGAGAYVANTGYGYGDTAAVALSEKLMAEFAGRLDGTMTVGQAMTYAKQAYAAQLGIYGAYDEKVLAEATFYGLPMFHISDQPGTPADRMEVPTTPVVGAAGVSASSFSLGSTDLATQAQTAPDGSTFLTVGDEVPQVTSGRPITPRTDRDVTATDGVLARGVLLTGLTSTEAPVAKTTFARAVVDQSSREPAIATDVAFPAFFASVNRYRDPLGERSQLVLLPGQFVPDDDPATVGAGTQRQFTQMDGTVYYSDSPDVTPPTFAAVDARANASTVTFTARVEETESSTLRVLVLYRDAPGAWKSTELAPGTPPGTWTGTGPVLTDEIEYLVQAVDTAGNVATTTNKGFLFAAAVDTEPPTVSVTSPTADFYEVGEPLVADFTCADANLEGCAATLNGMPVANGATVDTSQPSSFNVFEVTGTDAFGNVTTQTVTFHVSYTFVGFASPIAAGQRTEVKAGSAVPVRWQLTDANGYVSDRAAIVDIRSDDVACDTTAEATAELGTTSEVSGLTYDHETDEWQYVWRTERKWKGTCRQLVITFADGQTASAVFVLR